MGTFSWQSWSGCQLALQAEQNSSVQTLHRTNCGSGVSDSFSWHTAWHVEDGHQVRLGSSNTSVGGVRDERSDAVSVSVYFRLLPADAG